MRRSQQAAKHNPMLTKMKIAVCCAYFCDSLVEKMVQDLAEQNVEIHLWALDSVLPGVAQFTHGKGRLGKFQSLNRLLPFASNADLVLFVDDDVRLGPGFLSTYVLIVTTLGAAVAQPALTANSYYSHAITLQRRGCWARLTNFVESGPVVSMTRQFLDLVTPFPESNRMGWGLEIQWSAVARNKGLRLAVIDACPIEHTCRPVGARYDLAMAGKDMAKFLAEHRLGWPRHQVLREYLRVFEQPSEYLETFPAPPEAIRHRLHSDTAQDLPLLWAVASLVRPELIVELLTRWGTSTQTLVHAAKQWGGRVVTVDPVDARPYLACASCEFIHKTGEELFRTWSTPVKLLFINTDPHSYEQTYAWLNTWVKTWLADGGVAAFHDVTATRPEVRVSQAVRNWLREQPPIWRWQEFAGTSGLGLLWRVGDRPNFEALFAGAGPADFMNKSLIDH
jgi:predicted O-methyltransferase YrrM